MLTELEIILLMVSGGLVTVVFWLIGVMIREEYTRHKRREESKREAEMRRIIREEMGRNR
jgi:hypothetical protein